MIEGEARVGALAALLSQVGERVRDGEAELARDMLRAAVADDRYAEDRRRLLPAMALLSCLDGAAVLDGGEPPMAAECVAPLFREPLDAGPGALMLAASLAIAADPTLSTPRIEAACHLLVQQEPAWAEQALLPAWRGQETEWLVARVLSGIWSVLGKPDEALAAAEVACARMPGSTDVHIHHAGLLLERLQPAPALLAAGRALGIEPQNAVAWRIASAALLQLGHVRDAIAASRQAAAYSEEQRGYAEEVALAAAAMPLALEGAVLTPRTAPRADWAALPSVMPRAAAPLPLGRFLAQRLRILDALMLREARTMFGHSRLGYLWALFEPAMHVFFLSLVLYASGFSVLPAIGDSMPLFYMTGVLPYLFFCHLSDYAMDLPRNNRAVLLIPVIGVTDVFIARVLLRAATDVIVLILCLGTYLALGIAEMPGDPLELLLVYLALFGLSTGVAMINMVASTYSGLVEKLWPLVLRAQYFVSGIFYHPSMMPPEVRDVLLHNPLLHVIEWFREAFFRGYVSPYLDRGYVLQWIAGVLLIGTLLLAANRRAFKTWR